jgi:hypothetical protein
MHMIKMIELTRRAAKSPFTAVDLQRALSEMVIGGMYRWIIIYPPFNSGIPN